jgi:hypothetical protein
MKYLDTQTNRLSTINDAQEETRKVYPKEPYTTKTLDITLPPLYEQEMHCHISQHQEHTAEDCKTDGVTPERQDVEAERAENSRARYLNIKTIFVVNE